VGAQALIVARLLLCHGLEFRRATMPHAVQVSEATGPVAATINGVYRPVAGEGVGGKPVYKKEGDDTWIEYWPGRDEWQLKPGSDKGKDVAYLASLGTQKEAGVVEEVTLGERYTIQPRKSGASRREFVWCGLRQRCRSAALRGSNAWTVVEEESQQELDDMAATVAKSLALSQEAPPSLPPSSAHPVTRVKRWGDGLEAPAAGSRHFYAPGFMVTRDVSEAIKAFGHSPAEISQIMDAGRAKAATASTPLTAKLAAAIYAYTQDSPRVWRFHGRSRGTRLGGRPP
jgi:hypothetical protein